MKRFNLCPTFSQLIPHVFDSQSKPALARCSLSLPSPPAQPLLPTRCPETTTYCLSGRFPPRLYPPHSPEAYRGPVFISQLWMSENTFARLSTSQFARQESFLCQVRPQLSAAKVFVLVVKDFARLLCAEKEGGGRILEIRD